MYCYNKEKLPIPLFLLYVVMQRKFVEGVERSGLTGE